MKRRRGETPVLTDRTVDSQARSRSPAWGECVRSRDRPGDLPRTDPPGPFTEASFPTRKCERSSLLGRREAIMSDQRPRLGGASVPSTSVLLFHYTSYQPKTDAVQPIGNPNERLGIADASRMVSVRNNPPYRHSGSPDPTRQHSAAPHTTSTSMKIKSITSRLIHGSPIAFGHRPHSCLLYTSPSPRD